MNQDSITPIIILNWNRPVDTIACINSLFNASHKKFCIIIADNNSKDDSTDKILNWLKSEEKNFSLIQEGEKVNTLKSEFTYYIKLNTNHGFAKGNNIAIETISACNYELGLLLNNDTEVHPEFLSEILRFKKQNPNYKAITPLICYYDKKDIVWNAGGKLRFGFRSYYYPDTHTHAIREKQKTGTSKVYKSTRIQKFSATYPFSG